MKKLTYLSLGILFLLYACKEDDVKPVIESQTFEINATSSTEWKYFSFESNDTVKITDPSNSTDWDLAFQRYRIKTNSGKSGSGQGGAANSELEGQSGYDELNIVPESLSYAVDDTVQIAVNGGYAKYVVNPTLYGWFTMEMATMGTQIVPSDQIFIVKTGKGKFAKVWIKGYYSTSNVSGYVTIQYKYQPDGTKNLE